MRFGSTLSMGTTLRKVEKGARNMRQQIRMDLALKPLRSRYAPDFIFRPCEYCLEVTAQGAIPGDGGARATPVCRDCFTMYHSDF